MSDTFKSNIIPGKMEPGQTENIVEIKGIRSSAHCIGKLELTEPKLSCAKD
jgi:hypothetical protein